MDWWNDGFDKKLQHILIHTSFVLLHLVRVFMSTGSYDKGSLKTHEPGISDKKSFILQRRMTNIANFSRALFMY